jgi:hypothetical protein
MLIIDLTICQYLILDHILPEGVPYLATVCFVQTIQDQEIALCQVYYLTLEEMQ